MTTRTTRRVVRPRWAGAGSAPSLPDTSVEATALTAEALTPLSEIANASVDFTTLLGPEAAPVYGRIENSDFLVLLPRPDERRSAPGPSRVDGIRAMTRRAIGARAYGLGICIVPMALSSVHFEFRLVRGQWITSRTYALDIGDDREDVERIVAAALDDLAEDQRRYPA